MRIGKTRKTGRTITISTVLRVLSRLSATAFPTLVKHFGNGTQERASR
jgi:hypothetical protein